MAKVHAVLSPSSSARWIACPGSVILAPEGGKASRAAAEGSLMHKLAEDELTGNGPRLTARVGEVHTVDGFEFEVTNDMIDDVARYVDEARDAIGSDHFEVEVSVPIGHLTGEEGATGTADLVIFRKGEVEVRDAKFGRGFEVDAEENTQGVMYALGVLELYDDALDGTENVRIVIHQPRLAGPKEWVLTRAELDGWREKIMAGAEDVRQARTLREKDIAFETWQRMFLQPTSKGCKFCPAKATCPSLRAETLAAVEGEFDDLTAVPAEDIGKDFARIERVEAWCKAVRAEAERRLLQGIAVPGLKLVAGRRGARKWIDENEAEKFLAKLVGDDRWERSLISPTKAAKIVGKGADFGNLTTSSEGKPSVAFETDKRPAFTGTMAADDFDNLEQET